MDAPLTNAIPQIEALAQQTLDRYRLPGIALGIVRDGGLAWFGGYGRADLDRAEPPSADSLARVASVTKTFTATAIVQLRDAGKLALDDPLVQHIPEFSQVQVRAGTLEGVTLRRMLTHRAGLATESPIDGWGALRFPTRDEVLAALPATEVVIQQDSAWKYSNLAYGLLGEVIRRAAEQPYEAYLQAHLFDPLSMPSATFDLDDHSRTRLMTGYDPTPYRDRPAPAAYAHLDGIAAAGQLQVSIADLAQWVAFQLEGDSRILADASRAEMHRPQFIEADWSAGQCLGWRATRVGDRVYHEHGGGIHGFGTQVLFNRPSRTGAILFINMWPPHGGLDLAKEALERILADEPADRRAVDFSPVPEAYLPLLGTYCAAPGIWVDVVWRDGELRLAGSQGKSYSLHAPAELEPTDDERVFRVRGGRGAGERAIFTATPQGQVLGYALGGFEFRKLDV